MHLPPSPASQLTLALLFLATRVSTVDAGSQFGDCDDANSCDWPAYWRAAILQGISGWIIACILIVVLVVYLMVKCICCCCRGCKRHPRDSAKHRQGNVILAFRIVRIVTIIAAILALAGLIMTLVGWGNLDDVWDILVTGVNTFITALLRAADRITATLIRVAEILANIGTAVSESSISTAITPADISQVSQFTNTTVENLQNLETTINFLFQAYRWILLPITIITFVILLGLLTVVLMFRCSSVVATIMVVLTLLSTIVIWLVLGVSIIAQGITADICADVNLAIVNSSDGDPLLKALDCDKDFSNNRYYKVTQTIAKASNATATAVCKSLRTPCQNGVLICPTDAAQCSSTNITLLPGQILVNVSADSGGCNNQCTIDQCATACTSATFRSLSVVIVNSSRVWAELEYAMNSLISPLVRCTLIVAILIAQIITVCDLSDRGWNLIVDGSITLGVGGMLATICLILMADWFRTTKPQKDAEAKDADLDMPAQDVAFDAVADSKSGVDVGTAGTQGMPQGVGYPEWSVHDAHDSPSLPPTPHVSVGPVV